MFRSAYVFMDDQIPVRVSFYARITPTVCPISSVFGLLTEHNGLDLKGVNGLVRVLWIHCILPYCSLPLFC